MKIKRSKSKQAMFKRGALALVCLLPCLITPSLGQDGGFYDTEETKKAREANDKAVKKMLDLPGPQPFEPTPSRYAGEDPTEYTVARAAVFSMRDRTEDPFMLAQDQNAKPKERKAAPVSRGNRQAALPPTPLAEIVKLIRVTTIMPGEKKFLIGIRPFQEGDEFPLQYQEKTLRVKVVSVSSRKITFRDIEKEEEATLEMEMLPPGMIAGEDKIRPPGMLSEDSDLPLLLGGGDKLPSPNN